MARARGCILPAILAGTTICWTIAESVAVAQEATEVREDLGNSYLLARLTTAQGSIIETLLFDGQTIATDIVLPAPGVGMPAVATNVLRSDAVALPPGLGSGFTGTWLTGEIIGGYLVLHRIRANDPVVHDIFREGQKVGSVTEIGLPVRAERVAGRNSFTFERTGDRFVVHLRQPDGTTVHATTEQGRFMNQVVERSASPAAPPRIGGTIASGRQPETVRPPAGPSAEPQRLAQPLEAAGSVMMKEPAPAGLTQPETVPLPRPRIRPVTPAGAAALAARKPGTASAAAPNDRAPAPAKLHIQARETALPAAKPKTALAAENVQRSPSSTEKPATPAARPLAPAWEKSAEKPATPAAKPSLPSPWDASVRYWQFGR
jgi:hypothetical protein